MDGIESYHTEFLKPLLSGLDLLQRSNIMFYGPDVSLWKKYWRFSFMVPLQTLHCMSLMAYIVKRIREGVDPFEKADMVPIWLICMEHWVKSFLLISNKQKIRDVILELGAMWRSDGLNDEQNRIKQAALKYLYYGDIVINKCGQFVGWQYLLIPLFGTVFRRLILEEDVELELPFACEYPFEIKTWPVYLPVYAIQCYCTFRAAYVYMGTSWLIIVLTSHLVVQFRLLQEDLINLKPKSSNLEVGNGDEVTSFEEKPPLRIEDLVRRHQTAILLAEKLDDSYNKLTFTIMLFATLTICFFALSGKAGSESSANAVNSYGAMIEVMKNTYLLCYYSQLLNESSSGIALAAAKNMWYEEVVGYQRVIQIIIMRSQKPCTLTSLKFSPITLQTFNAVLKTTWSYFSLASQLYDEQEKNIV
uniref:Odorant receptor n=1 Tax=Glyphodes pyloalis TaxID=1242752 RepID=A0A6M3GRW5_GLYPY|nr:olfactory receptor [Glyphodes pyloalis]